MITDYSDTVRQFIDQWHNPEPFVMAHTSGSTGAPKTIKLLKTDMEISARATCRYFGINSGSTLLLPLSVDYIAGKMMLVRGICSQADVLVLPPGNNPFHDLNKKNFDLVAIVPSQIPALTEASLPISFRNVIVGGAPMTPEQESLLLRHGINAYATYGMTETCSHVALRKIGNNHYTALPGVSFGTDGRSCLTVSHNAMSFGTIATNDIVDLTSPTQFVWLGRYDNVINSGGIKIHPEADEQTLNRIISPINFYITSRRHDKWGEVPVLLLEGTDNGLADRYLASAAELLPRYHAPKEAVWIKEFERTSSGKIKRIKLL